MVSALSAPHFYSEEAAIAYVEEQLWPDGPICPHCGNTGSIGILRASSNRPRLWKYYKCYKCYKPFSLKIGTIFQYSKIPLHIWLQAIYLLIGVKKGISVNRLHRILGVTLKTAWFMTHRIRKTFHECGIHQNRANSFIVESVDDFGHDISSAPAQVLGSGKIVDL